MKTPPTSNDAFNIIALGAWNPAIFSPVWVKEHLANDQAAEVVMAFPLSANDNPPRITVDGIYIYPSPRVLMFDCVTYDVPSIDSCAGKIGRIAELLPHTPVSALGINFRFWGSVDDSAVLGELFTFADAARINADSYKASSASIKRSFGIDESTTLNLNIEASSSDLKIEFNFHSNIQHISDFSVQATADRIRSLRTSAVHFLKDVYEVELES